MGEANDTNGMRSTGDPAAEPQSTPAGNGGDNPHLRSARQRLLLFVGTLGPVGYLPASGTASVAVVGVPLFWLMYTWPWYVYFPVTLVFIAASIWLHDVGDRILGEKDSRKLVWDELAGFMVAVALVPFTWQLAAVAFFVERLIDIAKVPPANWIEKHVPGGWGVVGDDLIAGVYTWLLLQGLMWWQPEWVVPG